MLKSKSKTNLKASNNWNNPLSELTWPWYNIMGFSVHDFTVFNLSKIGKFSTLAPASVILGNVKIGNYTYIGANSTIRQNIKIGNNCIIGAGSVVTKNVKDNNVVVGSPAKFLKKNKI